MASALQNVGVRPSTAHMNLQPRDSPVVSSGFGSMGCHAASPAAWREHAPGLGHGPLLPWQKPGVLGFLFGGRPLLPALDPTSFRWVGPVPDPVQTVATITGQPFFSGASSSAQRVLKPHLKVRMRPSIREDDRRIKVVSAWRDALISGFPMASTSVQMLEAEDDQMRMQIMRYIYIYNLMSQWG
jgi:hypothetical protein